MAFYHPATVKGIFATGVSHGVLFGNANGFQGPSFFILDICDHFFLCGWENTNLYPFSYTFSYSPLILCADEC
jgi:hypothetical protein